MPPDDQSVVQPDEGDDLHALLSKAFDEHETPVETESRQRAPDGRFVKAEQTESEPVAEAPTESVEKPVEPMDAKPPETPVQVVEAPVTWKAADKEVFKTLPPEAQQILLRRHGEMDADYTKKMMNHTALHRDYEPVREILAPYEPQMRSAGWTPASLIQAWANVEKALMGGQGISVVRDLVTNYKIDRAQLAQALGLTGAGGSGGAGTEQPPAAQGPSPMVLPPEVATQLTDLQRRQQAVDQFLADHKQTQAREAENRVMSTITAFRDAKDDKGALLHPHYDALESDMIRLLIGARASGSEPPLSELYETAVWANTSTRQQLLDGQRAAGEAQRKADEKKTADEARAKAERAKKAGSSVTGSPGSGQARMQQSQDGNRSIRDELAAAYEEVADA